MSNVPPIKLTLFGGPKSRANYQLTQLGKTKAENFNVLGDRGEVVTALENVGPCTINELANETRMTPMKVKQVMQVLVRDGWVMKVTAES